MDADKIEWFLNRLGCPRTRSSREWITSSCPLAPWTHSGGRDDHPSFAISITDGESHARCLTGGCGYRGSLKGLLYRLQKKGARLPYPELLSFVARHDTPSVDELERKLAMAQSNGMSPRVSVAGITVSTKTARKIDPKDVEPMDERELASFTDFPPEVWEYLRGPKRRLSEFTVFQWSLGWHGGSNRIAIPVRDCERRLVGITGRLYKDTHCPRCDVKMILLQLNTPTYQDKKPRLRCPQCHRLASPKYMHSKGFHRELFLFGEHRIRTGVTGYVVEGHFDAIYLQQQGYNAVAVMGSSINDLQLEKLVRFFPDAVIIPDGDSAGYAAATTMKERILHRMPVHVVDTPEGMDPDEMDDDWLEANLGPPNLAPGAGPSEASAGC